VTKVDTFVCPSEPYLDSAESNWTNEGLPYWAANYAWNSGTWWPVARSWDGLFGRSITAGTTSPVPPDPPLGSIGFSACTDGLSNTLMIAEVANGPIGPEDGYPRTPVSECYLIPTIDLSAPLQALQACDAVAWQTGQLPWRGQWRYKGYPWLEGSLWRT
jgi:hypothetical protein